MHRDHVVLSQLALPESEALRTFHLQLRDLRPSLSHGQLDIFNSILTKCSIIIIIRDIIRAARHTLYQEERVIIWLFPSPPPLPEWEISTIREISTFSHFFQDIDIN